MKKIILTFLLSTPIFILAQKTQFVFTIVKTYEVVSFGTTDKYENKTRISEINEFSNYNADKLARFEDKLISNIMINPWFKGEIMSKKSYAFKTYAEASKKRNSFLMNN